MYSVQLKPKLKNANLTLTLNLCSIPGSFSARYSSLLTLLGTLQFSPNPKPKPKPKPNARSNGLSWLIQHPNTHMPDGPGTHEATGEGVTELM